jgi:hypothetical protein
MKIKMEQDILSKLPNLSEVNIKKMPGSFSELSEIHSRYQRERKQILDIQSELEYHQYGNYSANYNVKFEKNENVT